jgi:hypothetical protein
MKDCLSCPFRYGCHLFTAVPKAASPFTPPHTHAGPPLQSRSWHGGHAHHARRKRPIIADHAADGWPPASCRRFALRGHPAFALLLSPLGGSACGHDLRHPSQRRVGKLSGEKDSTHLRIRIVSQRERNWRRRMKDRHSCPFRHGCHPVMAVPQAHAGPPLQSRSFWQALRSRPPCDPRLEGVCCPARLRCGACVMAVGISQAISTSEYHAHNKVHTAPWQVFMEFDNSKIQLFFSFSCKILVEMIHLIISMIIFKTERASQIISSFIGLQLHSDLNQQQDKHSLTKSVPIFEEKNKYNFWAKLA